MKRLRMVYEKLVPRAIHLLMDRPWSIVVAYLIVLMATALFLGLALPRGDVDTLLRAIDAAHVIPAEENAAGLYTELAWDANLPTQDSPFLPRAFLSATTSRPWRSGGFFLG
jgi:hypothetical protein